MRHFTPLILGLCLLGSCATVAPSGATAASAPSIELERAPWIRSAHAQVVDSHVEVELVGAFPAFQSRRAVTVEAVDAVGHASTPSRVSRRSETLDARFHRSAKSRLSLALPQLDGARLRAARLRRPLIRSRSAGAASARAPDRPSCRRRDR